MKVKIDIELWDETPITKLEEVGLTEKFMQICYEKAFEQLIEAVCVSGMKHALSVEVEDNTAQN